MVGPLLFALYVALFVAVLYGAEHFVSTRWSVLRSHDSEPVALRAVQRDRD